MTDDMTARPADETCDPTTVGGALLATFGQGAVVDVERLRDLRLTDFRPRARLRRTVTEVPRPAHPVIDVHNHLGRWLTEGDGWMTPSVRDLLATMDECGIERVVNLDGRWGEELDANIARYDRAHPGRFATFFHVDWSVLLDEDRAAATRRLLEQADDAARRGARGVKMWKDLGLSVRDANGALVLPDDERVLAAARRVGELGLPILIHTADPVAFFDPLDEHNERVEELSACPQWWFGDPAVHPSFERLMAALEGLVAGAPDTVVIGAHVGCYAENLEWVGRMFTKHPNFHVDLGGRLAEIGRQPRAFARLVAEHPDRVLFGTDAFPLEPAAYRALYRFLETEDEHWPYAGEDAVDEVPSQGRWAVSSAALAPEHLEAVYRGNALRLGL